MSSSKKTSTSTNSSETILLPHGCTRRIPWNEIISLLSGKGIWTLQEIPSLQLQSITLSDGPHGVRKPLSDLTLQESHPATSFPAGCALACSWDTSVLKQVGGALAQECQYYNIQVLLGPAMNLKRHPAGGRNFEYFSEDPVLTGILAAAYVQGVQCSGTVGACVKHFAVNNQETHRMVVNAMVDERTLRELYLKGFEIAIKESHPAMIMGAYNQVNGTYCCNSPYLLETILRNQWNYSGVCVTDWGATHDRVLSIKAGMDLEMPGNNGIHHREIETALKEGRLSLEDVDACVERIIGLIKRYQPSPPTPPSPPPPCSNTSDKDDPRLSSKKEDAADAALFETNHQLAHDLAMECVVLLKNDNHLLPLPLHTKIALIGEFAKDHPRYQGMGSSHVSATRVANAYDALWQYTDAISFARGYNANDDDDDVVQQDLIDQAQAVALQGDVALLFLGLPAISESEGFDRPNLQMPKQHLALLEAICQVHSKVVVILSNGGVVEFPDDSFFSKAPQAILEGYLLGQAGGSAIVDLLFGKASPCGRLPETMPLRMEDIPANRYFPGTRDTVEYREGLNVGYRYFDTAQKQVRFPFGHGLTYTTFDYSDLKVQVVRDEERTKLVQVSFRLQNTGPTFVAKEVAQCYVHPVASTVYRPVHELKAFAKISLQPNEIQTVTFDLDESAFAFYDIGVMDWIVEHPAKWKIQIGASSRDTRLQQTLEFANGRPSSQLARESYPPPTTTTTATTATSGSIENQAVVDDDTFARRFGVEKEKVLDQIIRQKKRMMTVESDVAVVHRNSLLKEVARSSKLGKLFFWIVFRIACKEIKPGSPSEKRELRMVQANVENLPLRSVALFSKGLLGLELLDSLIFAMSGKWWSAVWGLGFAIRCSVADVISKKILRK